MVENKFFDKINLEHYHRYVSGMIKRLSDNIDERVDEKFKNFIENNVSDGEILDARGGERTLGDRLDRFDEKYSEVSSRLEQIVDYVTYEQFGAVGDGVTDDYESIFKTHEFANINNKKVITNNNKTYLIKNVTKPIIIKNDVDWGKSKFIIDDSEITLNESYINVFLIDSDSEEFEISIESLNKSTKYISSLSNETGFVYVENSNKKQYIRKGVNANDGENQQEVFFYLKHQAMPLNLY